MDWKKSTESRDQLLRAIEYAARCAVHSIDDSSDSRSDAAAAKAVLDLVQARSILVAEAAAMEAQRGC